MDGSYADRVEVTVDLKVTRVTGPPLAFKQEAARVKQSAATQPPLLWQNHHKMHNFRCEPATALPRSS
jgi:hypothetical protein